MLHAGTGREDITPPIGIAHINWGARTHDVAEGIHLPLWATVLVLKDEHTTLAIADVDLCVIRDADALALREVIAEAVSTTADHVRLSMSHTHAGPPFAFTEVGGHPEGPGMELVPAYRDKVRDALRQAARQAVLALRPARSAAGYGESDITVNRRLHLKDRKRTLVSQNVDGYTDRTLTVVRIDALDETPIASIVGYGSHPIILAHQNRQISPDYPGTLKRVFEKIVGGTCIFLQGCAGDQMPIEGLTGDLGAPERMGTRLAVDAARAALALRTRPVRPRFAGIVESGAPLGLWVDEEVAGAAPRGLAVVERIFSLPVRDYTDKDRRIAEAEALLAEVKAFDRAHGDPALLADLNYRQKRAVMNAKWAQMVEGRRTLEMEMQAMRIGDAALVSVPLEPFAHTGAVIRECSPFPVTQFAGYANGLIGYVPEAVDFPFGGYEVEWAGPFTEAAAEVLIGEAMITLDALAQAR
jgi:hypothetical protein